MSRRLAGFVVLVVLAGALAVTAYGDLPGRRVLPAGQMRFDVGLVTWAQGSTIVQGDHTYDVGAGFIKGMLPTPYGFFVSLSDTAGLDDPRRLAFFDGEKVVAVPGRIPGGSSAVVASPDGRYAGWVDREGPWTPAGRIAEVVVVDLRTGRAVFRDHENMGGEWGDDLADRYQELEPRFVGFDDEGRAYWQDAAGHGERWRVDLDTGEKENVEGDYAARNYTGPLGDPYNPRVGKQVSLRDGRVVGPLLGVATGSLSPDGRFVLGSTYRQRVQITVAETGRRVLLDHGRRNAFFGGWLDGGRSLYALATDDYRKMLDVDAPEDGTRGALVSCELPSGRCTDLREVHRLRSFVFGTNELGW